MRVFQTQIEGFEDKDLKIGKRVKSSKLYNILY